MGGGLGAGLAVDDDAAFTEYLTVMLRTRGYEALVYHSGNRRHGTPGWARRLLGSGPVHPHHPQPGSAGQALDALGAGAALARRLMRVLSSGSCWLAVRPAGGCQLEVHADGVDLHIGDCLCKYLLQRCLTR